MNHHIDIKGNTLEFRTTSFSADRGSILHSGIYNREVASSLAAGACIVIAGFFFAGVIRINAVHFFGTLVFFVILFLAFRTYIFRESVLRLVIDKEKETITVSVRNVFSGRSSTSRLAELDTVRQDYVAVAPENPDGVDVVEKIALQHGTVIPGFGGTAEFYTVELEFRGGSRLLIFSSREPSTARDIAGQIRDWLK